MREYTGVFMLGVACGVFVVGGYLMSKTPELPVWLRTGTTLLLAAGLVCGIAGGGLAAFG